MRAAQAAGRPKFPQAEREYFVEAIRYVDRVTWSTGAVDPDALPAEYASGSAIWAVDQADDTPAKQAFCDAHRLQYHVIDDDQLQGYPEPADSDDASAARRQRRR